MNYRELLKKYIDHVANCEGTTFLGAHKQTDRFTDEEWQELGLLDDECLSDVSDVSGEVSP